MLWENSSVVAVAHPECGGGTGSRNQITKMRRRAHFCDLISEIVGGPGFGARPGFGAVSYILPIFPLKSIQI